MLLDSLSQAWPPFTLVVGLLLIGQVANGDGLFEALGARIARAPLSPRFLLVALLALVAVVTAVLNLDTSVVFLTPVLVHAARRRGLDERPFLYGAVFMSNSASLLLPGSNLTNLLVLSREHVSGLAFARQMLPSWVAACLLTTLFLMLAFRLDEANAADSGAPPLLLGIGAASTLITAAAVLLLPNPAIPVLAIGSAATILRRLRPRIDTRAVAFLFVVTVGLGIIARAWHGPAELLDHTGRWSTAALAALTANLINNLPAAVLFSAHAPQHPRTLLLGLNLGPNLAVTGSLSAYLWLQAATAAHARPSIRTYSLLGLMLVPLTLAATLGALSTPLNNHNSSSAQCRLPTRKHTLSHFRISRLAERNARSGQVGVEGSSNPYIAGMWKHRRAGGQKSGWLASGQRLSSICDERLKEAVR